MTVTSDRPNTATAFAGVEDPVELTPDEIDAIERADTLDAGSLAELLADVAHDVSHRSTVGPAELRELAGLALSLARRVDVELRLPPSAE
jgi:hypothetical protein